MLCSSSPLLSIHHHPAVTNQVALGAQLNPVGLVHMLWRTDTIPFSEPSLTAFSTSICFHGCCSFSCACSHLCIARASYQTWFPLHKQWPGKAHMPETRGIHMSDDLTVGACHCCPDKAPPAAGRAERWLFPSWDADALKPPWSWTCLTLTEGWKL